MLNHTAYLPSALETLGQNEAFVAVPQSIARICLDIWGQLVYCKRYAVEH